MRLSGQIQSLKVVGVRLRGAIVCAKATAKASAFRFKVESSTFLTVASARSGVAHLGISEIFQNRCSR